MEWSRDLESGGDWFDSRLPEVRSGYFVRPFWNVLGSVWEWFGSLFGYVGEDFRKTSGGVRNLEISKMFGSMFLSRGASE